MKAFNEKCDKVLRYLHEKKIVSWNIFLVDTGIRKDDAILSYLTSIKGFVILSSTEIDLTQKGIDFISNTSFVEERDGSLTAATALTGIA